MDRQVSQGPYHVTCLNGSVCILVNNQSLLKDCTQFRDKIRQKLIEFESKRDMQKVKSARYAGIDVKLDKKGEIKIRDLNNQKFEDGFMVGAVQVHYYVENNGQFTKINLSNLIPESKYMAASGNLFINDENIARWLTTFSNLCSKGYKFVELSEKVKSFQTALFLQGASPKFSVHTIFGQPFSQFYNDEVTHPLFYQKKYQVALNKYNRVGSNLSRPCAARQLIVHVGDQVAQIRKHYAQYEKLSNKPIVPLIEMCEVWTNSVDEEHDNKRAWPTHTSACACDGCKFFIPYLITPCAPIKKFNEFYSKLVSQFLRTR